MLRNISVKGLVLVWLVLSLFSCKVYKQDVLFRLNSDFSEEDLAAPLTSARENYKLKVNDKFRLNVFTNSGERIIDPNNELSQGISMQQGVNSRRNFDFLIQADSLSRLPMVGNVHLVGLTVNEAEKVLQQAYDEFYQDCFVKIEVDNRRVVVLGVNGGQVIPLGEENMSIAEVLALYGGLSMGAKAQNIRLIRGSLKDPLVFQMDLTTVEGMRTSVTDVLPGDIIYVEPWRRPWQQGLRDISPILSISSSIIAFVLVIQNLSK